MAKKQENVPRYGTTMRRGIQYYRTRITDADGKRVDLYAETCEELQLKEMEARRQVEEAVFRRKHPTVAEYCEKWLLMQSAKVSSGTLRGYILSRLFQRNKQCNFSWMPDFLKSLWSMLLRTAVPLLAMLSSTITMKKIWK